MAELALAQAATGTPTWIPVLVGVVLGIGLIGVIILAIVQKGSRRRPRVQRDRCGHCGQPLAPGAMHCLHCGWVRPPPAAEVEFIFGPLEGRNFRLESEITTIGSQAGNTIVIPDAAVSRKHVGIRRDASGYELADLGSTNGVYVNGQRMAKRLLAAGDIIRIGASEMVFHLEKVG